MNPLAGLAQFQLEREAPPPGLAPFVTAHWRVRWDLAAPFAQEILPHPCVNLSLEDGRFEVHGPGTRRFVARLVGRGHVFGIKFTPAGFSRFAALPMRDLVDRVLGVDEAMGRPPPKITDDEPASVRATFEMFLRGFSLERDRTLAHVDELVARVQNDRTIARAEDLARRAGMSVRSLHRLFERHVGVGPKWIVRRSRVHEAAERVARGERIDQRLLRTRPPEGEHSRMIRALGDVPATCVAEHVRDVVLGVDLEDELHSTATLRAVRVLDALDPEWPAAELVTRLCVRNRFRDVDVEITQCDPEVLGRHAHALLREVVVGRHASQLPSSREQ